MNKILKNLIVIVISTFIFFVIGEIVFRAFFPEYRGFILSDEISYGKKKYMKRLEGASMRIREKNDSVSVNGGDHIILLIGDSISVGYGLAYEDIYWVYWQRKLDLKDSGQKIIALTDYGTNYSTNVDAIREDIAFYKKKNVHVDGVIYQFNLNDIVPYRPEDIKAYKHLRDKSTWLSKIIVTVSTIRTKYLNRSVMLRVLSNKLTHIFYNNENVPCKELGFDALGEYSYAFAAIGNEETALGIWDDFERDLAEILEDNPDIPIVILLNPISEFIDPKGKMHQLSRPRRLDCATIDPVEHMQIFCLTNGAHFVNPTQYMKKQFDNYVKGENPTRFYFINDDNHMNEAGSKYFAEYSYHQIFEKGLIP